jgi:hypothetical protein
LRRAAINARLICRSTMATIHSRADSCMKLKLKIYLFDSDSLLGQLETAVDIVVP